MAQRKFGRKVENVGRPGLNPGRNNLERDEAPPATDIDPGIAQKPIISRPENIDPGIVHGARPNPMVDEIINRTRKEAIDDSAPVGQEPSIRPRIFDPRKIQHKQLKDINKDLITRLNIEDREANRRQEALQRESRTRREKASKALQEQLEEQRAEDYFQAERRLDREGIQYDKDRQGRPIVRRDKEGKPTYTKKTGDIEIDEKTGRAFRMDRDSKGNLKRVDVDKDAKVGPDATRDDGFIYRQNKYTDWEQIDPEEGRFSSDRKVAVASAKYLYEKEKERIERLIDDPVLPPKLTKSEKKKYTEERDNINKSLEDLEKSFKDGEIKEEDYNESLTSLQNQLQEAEDNLGAGAEREKLERELYDLEGRGAAAFMKPGAKKEEGDPAKEEAGELKTQIETFEKEQEEFSQGIEAEKAELDALQDKAKQGGLSAEETFELTEEIKRKIADVNSRIESGNEKLSIDAEDIRKRSKDLASRQKLAYQKAVKERDKQLDSLTNPMTSDVIDEFRKGLAEIEAREKAWAELPGDLDRLKKLGAGAKAEDHYKKQVKHQLDLDREKLAEQFQAGLEQTDALKSEAVEEIEKIQAEVSEEVASIRMPVGGSRGFDPNISQKVHEEREAISNTLPERIRKSLTEKGFKPDQIEAVVGDFEKSKDVFNGKVDSALLSDGRIQVSPRLIYNSDDELKKTISQAGGTKEQQDAAFLEARRMQDQMGAEMAETIGKTKYGKDFIEFSSKFIDDFKKQNPHFIDKDGQYTEDSEGLRPTHGTLIRAFKNARGDLWNNIAWNEFGNSLGQIMAWVPAMMGSQKYKDAGAQLKKDNEELAQLGELIDSEGFFLGFTKRELMGGGLSLVPSMLPGMAFGRVATVLGAGGKAATTAGMVGATAGAFAQSGAPTYFDAREGFQTKIYNELLKAEGVDVSEISPERISEIEKESIERADSQALWVGLATGTITAVVMGVSAKLVGPKGVEAILNRNKGGMVPVRQVVRELSKKGLKKALKSKEFYASIGKMAADFGINVSEEFAEEFSDQLFNGILEANTFNPDKSFSEILAESWKAGVMGAVLAGGMSGAGSVKNGSSEGWSQWRKSIKDKKSSLDNISDIPSTEDPVDNLAPQEQLVSAELEIDNWTPPEGANPASIDLDKRMAKAAGRIAVGDIDSVSEADLNLLNLQRNKAGEVESAKADGDPWATAENGVPILGQTLIDSLSQRHPTLAKLLPKDEASQRQSARPVEEQKQAEQPKASEPSETKTPEEQEQVGGTFEVPVYGKEEPVQVDALDEEEAGRKVAEMGVGMVDFGGIIQTGVAKTPSPKPPSPETEEIVSSAISQIEQEKGRELTAAEKAGVKKAASLVSKQIEKWGKIFKGVGWTLESIGSGGMYTKDGNLNFSVPDLLRNLASENIDSKTWAEKAGLEEAIHLVAFQLHKEGKIDIRKLWKDLPKEIQDAVRKTYPIEKKELQRLSEEINVPVGEIEAEQLGNEFLRMIVQGRMAVKDGLWELDGSVVSTEQASKTLIQSIRKAFQEILDFFNGVMDSDEEFAVEIRKAAELIEQRLNELTAKTEEKPKPKPKKVAKKKVAQKEAPTRGPPTGRVEGSTAQVINAGRTVNVRYEVRSASDSKPSHDALGRKTEGYPQELQPRDRSTKEYRQQARNIANNLDFDKAVFFPGTDTPATTADIGAPIITQEGAMGEGSPSFTLIGNGRDIGAIESYRLDTPASKDYKQKLIDNADKFGLDPEAVSKIKDPVLYRVITDNLSTPELIRFSQESNEGEAMASNAVELAGQDAQRLTPQILYALDPEFAIDSKKNQKFLTLYTQKVIGARSANEANITKSDLARRAKMAIFTAAYGLDAEGRAALDRMSGDSGDAAKRLTNALITVSPMVARMRQDIEAGALNDLDISNDIAKAVQKISSAIRDAKNISTAWESLEGQGEFDLGGKGVEDLILDYLVTNRGNRSSLENAIGNYVESVYRIGDPRQEDMFGKRAFPSREELWNIAAQDVEKPVEETQKAAKPLNVALKSQQLSEKNSLQESIDKHKEAGIKIEPFVDSDGRTFKFAETILKAVQKLPPETREELFRLAVENQEIARSEKNELPKEVLVEIANINKKKIEQRTLNREDYRTQWNDHIKKYVNPEEGIDYNKDLETEIDRLAQENGAIPLMGPIKGDRAIDKAIDKAEERMEHKLKINPNFNEVIEPDFNELTDVIRGSLIATTNAEVDQLVDSVYENPNWTVIKNSKGPEGKADKKDRKLHKNRFKNPVGGYKDHMILVEMAPGVIAEIQVHRADTIYAKEVGPGHLFYETTRQIIESKVHKRSALGYKGTRVTRTANKKFKEISRISKDYYTNSSNIYEDQLGDKYDPNLKTQRAAASSSAEMRRASSSVISSAPESTVSVIRARRSSSTGLDAPAILRKPGPTSQGIPVSDRTNDVVTSGITPINTSIPLKAQDLDLFNDYAKTLPARTKASKPVFKRKVAKDLPAASGKDIDNLFDWFNVPVNEDVRGDAETGTQGAPDLGEGLGQSERGEPSIPAQQSRDSGSKSEDDDQSDQGRGRVDERIPTDTPGESGRAEATDREGTETIPEDERPSGEDARREGREESPRVLERPEVDSPERNHTIESQEDLNPSGVKARIKANVKALKLLRTLEKEDRNPTPEEKSALAKFSGWGAVPQVFDRIKLQESQDLESYQRDYDRNIETANKSSSYMKDVYLEEAQKAKEKIDRLGKWEKKFGKEARALKELLTEDEWETAAASITNAHFTSIDVIKGMWDAVERMGFKGGVALEPAAGVGHFFGAMPDKLSDRTSTVGVELDSISGRIFSKLYPETNVFVQGYQDAPIEPGAADLVISNVPFENTFTVDDKSLGKTPKFNLHNYFFAKALQSAKPGGIVAFITTHFTMDASADQRRWLAKHGDLVGAIRLPNTAFKKNAGTEVTTDIIFLRKPDGKKFEGESWSEVSEQKFPKGGPVNVNEYFIKNPQMILGRLSNDGSMFATEEKGELTVHPTGDLGRQLSEAVNRLPSNIFGEGSRTGKIGEAKKESKRKQGSIYLDGKSIKVEGVSKAKLPKRPVVESFIQVRDSLNNLLEAEKDPNSTEENITSIRNDLNRLYDLHVKKHKNFHTRASKGLSVDPDYYRVLGLELQQEDGSFKKASIFNERVMRPVEEPTSADSQEDALAHSLSWKGLVDIDYMAQLLGQPKEKILDEFVGSGLGFINPDNGLPEIRNHYLSGNVREKLLQAKEAAKTSEKFESNVEALEAIQPKDLKYEEISYYLGSAWIPGEVIEDFAQNRMNLTMSVNYMRTDTVNEMVTEKWDVQSTARWSQSNAEFDPGVPRYNAQKILESVLNLRTPIVRKNVGTSEDPQMVIDEKATANVKAAQERMKLAFKDWIDENEGAQNALTANYNENFNNYVEPTYNGQHMVLPWINPKFDLFPAKKDVVFRAIQDRRGLIAHGVGGGKTVIATAIAMEMKRLGLANKPLIAVHNATLEQFSETVREMAPDANILVARRSDLAGAKRKEFYGKIASGDWDMIIMAQSTLDRIPDDPAYERKILNEVKDQFITSLQQIAIDEGKDTPTVKELQKRIKSINAKIAKLQKRKVDDILTFQEMGIDALILDEAHLYKKLPYATKLGNQIAGIDRGASQRGTSFLTKSRYIQENQNGKNIFTMTGTPVTNTLGETWNMIRMVAPDLLSDFNVSTFDSFATTFTEIETRDELRPNGRFKRIQRLSKISNIPEWNRLFRQVADVKLGEKMDVKNRPEIEGGEALLKVVPQTEGVNQFTEYIFKVIDKFDNLEGKQKREFSYIPLVSFGAARAAAIDMRMVDPNAKDEPGSKLNKMIDSAIDLYKKHDSQKATQVVFADTFRAVKRVKLEEFLEGNVIERDITESDVEEEVSFEDNEFNLYQEIKNKLASKGVPEEEIADIQDYKTPESRQKLFDKVNNGEVRFVLGSTQKLGTGVNMQERMIAAHHLDVPWTPADLEQRDGRVYRQGNIFSELNVPIHLNRYGMQESLDAALWDKIEFKERFIRQAMSGEMNARVIEEDEGLLSLAEQKAILMGADGLRFFQVSQEIEALVRERKAHDSLRERSVNNLSESKTKLEFAKAFNEKMTTAMGNLENKWDEDMEFGIELNNIKYEDTKKGIKALDRVFKAHNKSINNKRFKTLSELNNDKKLREPLASVTVDGVEVELSHSVFRENLSGKNQYRSEFIPIIKMPDGLTVNLEKVTSADTFEKRIRAAKEKINIKNIGAERTVARETENIPTYTELAERPFPREKELQDMVTEYREIGPKFDADMGIVDSIDPLSEEETSIPLKSQNLDTDTALPSHDLGGKKPSREKMADAMIAANQMLPRDRSRKQFAYEYRNAMPNQKWLTAYELGNRLFRGSAEGKAASQSILNRWVESGLVDRMWTEDGTPIYAWSGTKPEKGLLTMDQINKKYPEDAPQFERFDATTPNILKSQNLDPETDARYDFENVLDELTLPPETLNIYSGGRLLGRRGEDVVRKALLYKGEKSPPKIKEAILDGGESSNVSESIYPVILVELENGAEFRKIIRISRHDQLSSRSPRGYDLDYRGKNWTEVKSDVLIDLQNLADDIWEEQKKTITGEVVPAEEISRENEKNRQERIGYISRQIDNLEKIGIPARRRKGHLDKVQEFEERVAKLKEELVSLGTQTTSNILKSQNLAEITGDTEIDVELKKLYQEALNEQSGERTIGNPELAIGAEDPAIMSVDEYRKTAVGAETFEQWNAEAKVMVENDYEGTAERIKQLGFEGGTLDPVLTRAAQMIVAQEMSMPMTKERRENVQKLVWAYRATGTEQARGLASRRDPFKTPEERHKEFLGKVIFTPPAKVRKKVEKARTQEEKQKILDKDAIRIQKIEKELARMGVTFDDIFRGEVELTLKGSKIKTNITEGYSAKQKMVIKLFSSGKTLKQIAKMVELTVSEVKQVRNAFKEEFVRRHSDKVRQGVKAEDLSVDDETLILKSSPLDLSEAEVDAEIERMLLKMGIPPLNKIGKMKTRKRKPKKKMFRPPAPSGAEQDAKWDEFKDRDFEPDSTDYVQEVMVGVDLYDPVEVVKIARAAQSADSNGWSMLHEYWINNILSGPQTHVVNVTGNVANAAWDFTVQRGMEAMLNTIFKSEKGATFKEYRHIIKGIMPGVARGMRLALKSWGAETDFFRAEVLNEQIDLNDGYIKGEGHKSSVRGKKGKVIRIPGRALLFADTFFKGLFGTMEAGAQGYRISKAQGLKGKELEKKIAEYVNTPNSQAWQIAVDKATDLTFQTPLRSREEGGNWAEAAVHWISMGSRSVPLLNWVIPFARTPFNIFKQGMRKSPLGTINFASHFLRNGLFRREKGQTVIDAYPELIRDAAEQVLAWTAYAVLHGAVEGDDDDDEKFFLITGSRPPRSGEAGVRQRDTGGDYVIKIGDLKIPYGRVEPFSTILGTTADLIRATKSKATSERVYGQLWGWMLGQARNKTFMRGLGDVAKAIEKPESASSYTSRFVKNAIVPNLIRQPIRNVDKYDREWRSKEWWYDILPLPSGAEKKVDPATGRYVERAGTAATRLVIPKIEKTQKLVQSDKFLVNWNRENPAQTWGPTTPSNSLNMLDGKGHIKLGPNSYKYLVKRSATLAQGLLDGKLSPFDIKEPRERKLNEIQTAYRKGREQARDELRSRPEILLKK